MNQAQFNFNPKTVITPFTLAQDVYEALKVAVLQNAFRLKNSSTDADQTVIAYVLYYS